MNLAVVFEDNHLLVVDKPAGLLVQGDSTGEPHLVDLAESYRKDREGKVGKAFIGLVHRLDRPVSGLVILAKTSKAASRLSDQIRRRQILKIYFAVVERSAPRIVLPPSKESVLWEDILDRPGVAHNQKRSFAGEAKGQKCLTRCRLRESSRTLALIELQPLTGRKHQLRAQTSMRGLPIVGDRRYGASERLAEGIALHAAGLRFEHPTRREAITLRARPPLSWSRFPFSKEGYRIDFGDYPSVSSDDDSSSNISDDEDEEGS